MLSHPALMLKLRTTVSCQLCAQVLEQRLSQWLTEWKIPDPAVEWKKTPRNSPCKQGITAFIFVCCSRIQKVYLRPGPGYKIKESAAKKELNPMISSYFFIYLGQQQTNESIWEKKNSISSPVANVAHARCCSGLLSAKPGCPVTAVLIIVFIPLKTTWLGAELNWFVNNVYPFFLATKQTTN